MREIKFRAWIKNRNKMVEVEEIDFIAQKQIAYDEIEYRYTNKEPFHYTQWVDFDEVELMQSTGIRDKNGVDIYEGDVFIDEDGYIGVVRYCEQFAWFVIDWYETPHSKEPIFDDPLGHLNIHNMEVIGNIYTNKELLENVKN